MKLIKDELDHLKIEEKLKKIVYLSEAEDKSIEWGMNYIFFSSSKRVRPLLTLESSKIFNAVDHDAYLLAAAVELIHTYSLVHDDLPCMDDDDLRRGQATLHTITSEAFALLVGDALLTRAFDIISQYSKNEYINEILRLITQKAGFKGMIYGQVLDMEGEGQKLTKKQIDKINQHKTANLLELSLLMGAVNGGADQQNKNNLEKLGSIIGHIFQIKDDILDITGNSLELGKNTGSDEKNNKSSIPLIIGLDQSQKLLNDYENEALDLIQSFQTNQDFFKEFIKYLMTRTK